MNGIKDTMVDDHRRCDRMLAELEEAVSKDDWDSASTRFDAFQLAMAQHLSMEEDVLFPALEQRTGQAQGPTGVMRMEHTQLRQLTTDMSAALAASDQAQFLGLSETLMMLMQQHNMKEEQMLYPMADSVLGDDKVQVLERMQSLATDN